MAKAEAERLSAGKAAFSDSYTLSLRANLLRWATLTPDLGLEWRISPSVGIMVNGSWTSWTWNDNARRYALWEVMPEVRWYLGEKKAWYVGAMFKAGQFNYKFSGTGLESDLTAALADFNADKTVPLTLGGEAVVPDEAGVTATIDDWQPGNGGEDVEIY